MESKVVPTEDLKDYRTIEVPTRRGCELVEQSLQCLCSLANYSEYREQMAYMNTSPTLYAMKVSFLSTNNIYYLYFGSSIRFH